MLKSGKLRICENQVFVDSQPERLERGAEGRKDSTIVFINKESPFNEVLQSCT